MKVKVYTVEHCYDGHCTLSRVFGTRAEADAYAGEEKAHGTIAEMTICEWEVTLPPSSNGEEGKR